MAVTKRKRQHKVSKGERRSSLPVRLSTIQKVLMGKGQFVTFKPIGRDR